MDSISLSKQNSLSIAKQNTSIVSRMSQNKNENYELPKEIEFIKEFDPKSVWKADFERQSLRSADGYTTMQE